MVFFYVLRLFVVLCSVLPTLCDNIDEATIEKAKNKEWIPLPSDSEEEMVKFLNVSASGIEEITYDVLEKICEKEDSHLASFRSEEEEKYILGY